MPLAYHGFDTYRTGEPYRIEDAAMNVYSALVEVKRRGGLDRKPYKFYLKHKSRKAVKAKRSTAKANRKANIARRKK